MEKKEFTQALRDKLREIPLETRKTWKTSDLLVWWMDARAKDSYLTWESCHGDLWQYVSGTCSDLIGKKAM